MSGEVITIIAYTLLFAGAYFAAARGLYFFFAKARLYHMTTKSHSCDIELRYRHGDISDYLDSENLTTNNNELTFDNLSDELKGKLKDINTLTGKREEIENARVYRSEDISNDDDILPELLVDLDDSVVYKRGESWGTKFGKVFIYYFISIATTAIIVTGYIQVLFGYEIIGSSTSNGSEGYILALIAGFIGVIYFTMRLSAFLNLRLVDWNKDEDFRDAIYNSWYSFNMSLLALLIVFFFVSVAVYDAGPELVLSGQSIAYVFTGLLFWTLILALVVEGILYIGNVPDEVKEIHKRDTVEIKDDLA